MASQQDGNNLVAALRVLAELISSSSIAGTQTIQGPAGATLSTPDQISGGATNYNQQPSPTTSIGDNTSAEMVEEVGWIWWLFSPIFTLLYYAMWLGVAFGVFQLLKRPHVREMLLEKVGGLFSLVSVGSADSGSNHNSIGHISTNSGDHVRATARMNELECNVEELKKENASLKNQIKKLQNRELATRQHLLTAMDGARRSEKKVQGADDAEQARETLQTQLETKEQELRDVTAYSSLLETQVYVLQNQLDEMNSTAPALRSLQAAGTISKTAMSAIQNGQYAGGTVHVSVAEELQGKNEVLVVLVGQKEAQIERLGHRVTELHDHIRRLEGELWAATQTNLRSPRTAQQSAAPAVGPHQHQANNSSASLSPGPNHHHHQPQPQHSSSAGWR